MRGPFVEPGYFDAVGVHTFLMFEHFHSGQMRTVREFCEESVVHALEPKLAA